MEELFAHRLHGEGNAHPRPTMRGHSSQVSPWGGGGGALVTANVSPKGVHSDQMYTQGEGCTFGPNPPPWGTHLVTQGDIRTITLDSFSTSWVWREVYQGEHKALVPELCTMQAEIDLLLALVESQKHDPMSTMLTPPNMHTHPAS